MKKSGMSATNLRAFLIVVIILLIGLSAVGFYFAQNWLRDYAKTVGQTVADSTASGNDVQSLKKLEEELATRQEIITKANSITTSSLDYQNQVIKDLDLYASDAGIVISNYNFVPTVTPGVSTVTISLTSPISYQKLLRFMSSIESNLPKMQISSINLGRISGDSASVKTDQLTVEVYTR